MVRVKTDNTKRECINILVRHLANSHVQKKWDKNNFDTPFQIGEREKWAELKQRKSWFR